MYWDTAVGIARLKDTTGQSFLQVTKVTLSTDTCGKRCHSTFFRGTALRIAALALRLYRHTGKHSASKLQEKMGEKRACGIAFVRWSATIQRVY